MKTAFIVLSSLYSEYLESLSLLEKGLVCVEKFGNTDKGCFRKRKGMDFRI